MKTTWIIFARTQHISLSSPVLGLKQPKYKQIVQIILFFPFLLNIISLLIVLQWLEAKIVISHPNFLKSYSSVLSSWYLEGLYYILLFLWKLANENILEQQTNVYVCVHAENIFKKRSLPVHISCQCDHKYYEVMVGQISLGSLVYNQMTRWLEHIILLFQS